MDKRTVHKILSHPTNTFPTEVNGGATFVFFLQLSYSKQVFCNLFNAKFFTFLCLCVCEREKTSQFKMTPKCSTEVLFSILEHKKTSVCQWKEYVC